MFFNRKKPESLLAGAPKMGRLRYTGMPQVALILVIITQGRKSHDTDNF